MQEELDPTEQQYQFAELKLLLVDSATSGAPINIGTSPAAWLQRIAPTSGPKASVITDWVNEIFTSDHSLANLSTHSCRQPMKCEFSTYEMVTTIRGQSQYTELQNSSMRCIDECTDHAVLSFNLPLPANDHVEWHASQTESLESFRRPRGQIADENEFLQQYLRDFEKQLDRGTQQLGANLLDTVLPFTYRDKQSRLWNAIWAERCCLTDQGGFCHAARKINLIGPRCSRASQVLAHFSVLKVLAERTNTTGLMSSQGPHERSPLYASSHLETTSSSPSHCT